MKKCLINLTLVVIFASCSNTPDMETGEIRTLKMLKQTFEKSNRSKGFIDTRTLLTRKQIDAAKIPVLFVELASGQNGTLTPYPGKGIGQTWLGADGATITMNGGVLMASRGLGDDLMGSSSLMPPWSKIKNKKQIYSREINHITGNNKILKRSLSCDIQKIGKKEVLKIWDVNFKVSVFEEYCRNSGLKFKNTYYIDTKGIMRRSLQYHSNSIGYILTERLDR